MRIEDICEADDYPGIRVHLLANYEKMSSLVTVDVTTDDKITPESVEYSYPLLFDDRSIAIMSYSLATTLAEKLEIAISRSVTNTRPRDYYDLHTLWLTRRDEAKPDVLRDALATTVEKRGSHAAMGNYREVMAQVASDDGTLGLWAAYARRYPYVGDMTLGEACGTVVRRWSSGRSATRAARPRAARPRPGSGREGKLPALPRTGPQGPRRRGSLLRRAPLRCVRAAGEPDGDVVTVRGQPGSCSIP